MKKKMMFGAVAALSLSAVVFPQLSASAATTTTVTAVPAPVDAVAFLGEYIGVGEVAPTGDWRHDVPIDETSYEFYTSYTFPVKLPCDAATITSYKFDLAATGATPDAVDSSGAYAILSVDGGASTVPVSVVDGAGVLGEDYTDSGIDVVARGVPVFDDPGLPDNGPISFTVPADGVVPGNIVLSVYQVLNGASSLTTTLPTMTVTIDDSKCAVATTTTTTTTSTPSTTTITARVGTTTTTTTGVKGKTDNGSAKAAKATKTTPVLAG